MTTSDQVADDEQVHSDDDGQWHDVGEREERDEERQAVAVVIAETAEVVRRGVGRQHERLDAVQDQQRRVDDDHGDPDGGHDPGHPPACRRRTQRRPNDCDEANDGDGDQRVDGDVDRHVEDEVRQFTGDVADKPVVSGVVVGDERYGDDEEDDVADGEIQQQQVDGRSHRATRQSDVDDQRVADQSDADDQTERHRDDDLGQDVVKQLQDVVKQQLAFQVDQPRIIHGVRRCYRFIVSNCCS